MISAAMVTRRAVWAGAAVALSPAVAAGARTSATPVGPLPKGPTTAVTTGRGSLVAVALPRQRASSRPCCAITPSA